MAIVNHEQKQVTFKIVYCGTPLGGKTSNLQYVHSQIGTGERGDLLSLATSSDRTLFFDFLPVDAAEINGYRTKFQLYTVPGQVYYNATRQLVLRGVDGIVFVADSSPDRFEENIRSFQTTEQNLRDNRTPIESLPFALQYNKRDLPNATPVEHLDQALNNRPNPSVRFEACAANGYNVFAALSWVSEQILTRFHTATSSASPSAATAPA